MFATVHRVIVLFSVLALASPSLAEDISRSLREGAGEVGSLREELARKVAQSPDDAESWRDLGVCEVRMGNADAALRAFERSMELDAAPDKWRDAYRALALEGSGRADDAARSWEALAEVFPRHAERLKARAAAIRLWDQVRVASTENAASVAVLPPEALGEDPQQLGAVLSSSITAALGMTGLQVYDPAATTDLLARRGRRADELQDEEGRGRVGRALSQSGVEALVTSGYLVMEDGTFLLSIAVLPVNEEGVDATRPYQATAPVARAIETVPQLVATIAADLGVEGAQASAIAAQLPATPAGARALAAADQALQDGDLAGAIEGWGQAVKSDPGATALADRVEGLAALGGYTDDPVVVQLRDPAPVIDVLVDEAGRDHRRKRKFTDQ